MTGHRSERVGHHVQVVVTRLIRKEIRDPRIGFVTVTGVEMSGDLRHARVFVSAMGSAEQRREALAALEHAVPFFRRAIGRELSLRFAPEIVFEEDRSIEQGFRVDSILRELGTEDAPEAGSELPGDAQFGTGRRDDAERE